MGSTVKFRFHPACDQGRFFLLAHGGKSSINVGTYEVSQVCFTAGESGYILAPIECLTLLNTIGEVLFGVSGMDDVA